MIDFIKYTLGMVRPTHWDVRDLFEKYFNLLIEYRIKTGAVLGIEDAAKIIGCNKNTLNDALNYFYKNKIDLKVKVKIEED